VEIPETNDRAGYITALQEITKDNIKFKENNVHGLIF
jgi:hypothetical protein